MFCLQMVLRDFTKAKLLEPKVEKEFSTKTQFKEAPWKQQTQKEGWCWEIKIAYKDLERLYFIVLKYMILIMDFELFKMNVTLPLRRRDQLTQWRLIASQKTGILSN